MKTTEEMIEVMQAFERGERIQARAIFRESDEWLSSHELAKPAWDWVNFDYRIKPREPRVIWVNEYARQQDVVHDTAESAFKRGHAATRTAVKYIEVIE